jgi:hypothetical protein
MAAELPEAATEGSIHGVHMGGDVDDNTLTD